MDHVLGYPNLLKSEQRLTTTATLVSRKPTTTNVTEKCSNCSILPKCVPSHYYNNNNTCTTSIHNATEHHQGCESDASTMLSKVGSLSLSPSSELNCCAGCIDQVMRRRLMPTLNSAASHWSRTQSPGLDSALRCFGVAILSFQCPAVRQGLVNMALLLS